VAARRATRLTRTGSVRAGRDPFPGVSKRSRQRSRQRPTPALLAPPTASGPPPAPEPEQLLLDQIAAGALDEHLHAIADAVSARIDLLDTVNSAKALAMLNIGDRVRFNHHTRPQYLRGVEGVIIELDRDSASVCVHGPVGRFRSGTIHRCPPLILERLNPAA
jgi:hypothetical protein